MMSRTDGRDEKDVYGVYERIQNIYTYKLYFYLFIYLVLYCLYIIIFIDLLPIEGGNMSSFACCLNTAQQLDLKLK